MGFRILLLIFLFLSACRQATVLAPAVEGPAPVSGSPQATRPNTSADGTFATSTLQTATPMLPPTPANAQATHLPVKPPAGDLVPCGTILPLIPPEKPLISNLDQHSIPAGLVPDAAYPALQRILQAPDTVGLAAFEVGRESEGVFLNADAPMPLASVVKILNLIAYANAVNAGTLDPGTWIPLSEMDRYYLPGTDLGAHAQALDEAEAGDLIGRDPPSTPLEEIPWMMIRHSSNAAADFLHMAIGQEGVERTALELDLTSQTAPCPWIGQFLAMSNHERDGDNRSAVTGYMADPSSYGFEVMRLTESFANDAAFREAELSRRSRRGQVVIQQLFADTLNPQASAGDYARLMARIMTNGLGSSYANILVRRVLEWPKTFPTNQELFSTVGYKNGSLPGVLTTVYYGQRLEDGKQVVVALFYRRLPMQTYRSWRQNLPHDELARWLLADPEAISLLRDWLVGSGE